MVSKLPLTKYQIFGNSLLIVNQFGFVMLMASSLKRRRSYDVFLSFRGIDVRNNFLGHLYKALDQRGINTYVDSEELRKGEQISPALMEAIEESQIAIVVFSENYASSTWCLDELAKIMECKEQRDLIVFPVFYRVEPREVRTPRNNQRYGQAMAKHEEKFEKDPEKVKKWKKALHDASSLSRRHVTENECEPQLIQDIVHEISTQLDRTSLHVAKYPVGIDSRVQELKTILNLQSKDDVFMVGLWGQGGVGKTTLAKAIYNAVFREFRGSSFLEHVGENSKHSNDLVALQEKLLSEVLLGKKLTVYNAARGIQLIQDRLCNKKVLVILDDVDDECQLNALAGNCEWFGKGSRIIITTRNRHLLTSHGVEWDHTYEVKALMNGEALELFKKHAFLGNKKIEISRNLVERVVHHAKGLPLALEVLGSFLCGRGEHLWESALEKLAKSPHKKINDVLKVSYNGLEPHEREIFLDIACFFKGQKTKYIRKVLDGCDFNTTIGIDILIERSLISEVRETETLQMHDLIQSMGMDIVKEECYDDPSKRSRLWLCDDVRLVLSRDMETSAVKAIVLRLPEREEMYIGPNAFTNMRMLRLLILRNVHNPFPGPIHLPKELRWFEWPHCASIPEFRDGPKKLVGLDLQNTNIKIEPKQFKGFEKLKFINFSKCRLLHCMPDLRCTPHLEELDLHGCTNLENAHQSIAYHRRLWLLDLSGCSKLQSFPDIPIKNKSLRNLCLKKTSIEELPVSIENLVSLENMNLDNCKNLVILPSSIYRLTNLASLSLHQCSKLINFPKKERDSGNPDMRTGFPKLLKLHLTGCNLSEIEFLEDGSCFLLLKSLCLGGNNFTNLPSCEHLCNLECLNVGCCKRLQEIPVLPWQLQFLFADNCESLSKIPSDIGEVRRISLVSCNELVYNKMTSYGFFKLERFCAVPNSEVHLPGGEMPEWLVPNNEGYIYFMASKEFFKKFLGISFCVVLREKETPEYGTLITKSLVDGKHVYGCEDRLVGYSDHMRLEYSNPWEKHDINHLGPNDWSCFQYIIRASNVAIVKKCGFRLICKPLESYLEVFLQQNPLLDQALLYEVQHDDCQMSEEEKSSNETEALLDSKTSAEENNSSNLVLKRSNIADFSLQKCRYSLINLDYRNVRPGGEMPKEFIPVEDGTICFMASQDLYDKFLGLALCIVFSVEDGKKEVSFDIVPHVNGEKRNVLSGALGSFDSDHVWIQYLKSNILWGLLEGGVDFGQFSESYLRFSLRLEVSGGTMKKLGYKIRCRQLEDDLKVALEDNPLVNFESLHEDSHEPADSDVDHMYQPAYLLPRYFRKCHLHNEEPQASYSETDQSEDWECLYC